MTNADRWYAYTEGLKSPDNFIRWGWRYVVSASLQRRVWLPPEHNPCFANQYQILVAPPGVGKGLIITKVLDLLRYWTLEDGKKRLTNGALSNEQKAKMEAILDADLDKANEDELQPKNKQNSVNKPLLLPIAADDTTYEALVGAVAKSYRRINYTVFNQELGKNEEKIYGHSSLCFALPELASLLHAKSEKTVKYLLGLYDCPLDYEYDTKNQGKDRVRRGCLNLLAGTQPDFMQELFRENLVNQGFNSRLFVIFADKNRHEDYFFMPELTPEQKQQREELAKHVFNLTALYGPVQLSAKTKEFLDEWWKTEGSKKKYSPKLQGYASRKIVHILKVAMCEHFGESTDMEIPLETYQKAIDILNEEEKNMTMAITIAGKNEVHAIGMKILDILRGKGPKDFVELWIEVGHMAKKQDLEDALNYLNETKQIDSDSSKPNENLLWKIKQQ